MNLSIAGVSLCIVSFAVALLDKPALWPDLSKFTQPLSDGLPRQAQVVTAWPAGTISKLCRDNIVRDGLDPTTFLTYSISFNDVRLKVVIA